MYKCRMTAYEGNEPYIFISYAHKDSDLVLPILDVMTERGYRIWYDDGIAPGSEWPEYIAEHLSGSSVCLAFVSNNSVASPNCRREINYALSKNINFMAIMLEDAKMSPGMELQLSSHQCVFRNRFSSDETFVNKVSLMKELDICRGKIEENKEEDADDIISNFEAEDSTQNEEIHNKKEKKSAKKEKQAKTAKASAGKGKVKKLLIVIPAVVVAFIILGILVSTVSNVKICGEKISKNEKYVFLNKKTITASDAARLGKMKKATTISLTDCTFEKELNSLAGLKQVNSLTITNPVNLTDYSFVESMTGLHTLKLSGCTITGEMNLENLTLTSMDLSRNEKLSSLKNVSVEKLREVTISDTGISDISFLAGCENLTIIRADNSKITDINALAEMEKLKEIDFSGCRLVPVNKDFLSLSLEIIEINNTGLTDLKAFENMTVVKNLGISGNKITDATMISKSAAKLTELKADGNPLNDETLQDIAKCTGITVLSLNNVELDDLMICKDMTEIKEIYAAGCNLTSLKGLLNKKKLKKLDVSDNKITSLDELSSSFDESLNLYVNLRGNNITDVGKLPKLSYNCLVLNDNPIDSATFFEGITCNAIVVDYCDGLEDSKLANSEVRYYYIVDVPLDKRLTMEEKYGSMKVKYATSEEIINNIENYEEEYSKWELNFK